MLILNNEEIQQILEMKDCIGAMEIAFRDLAAGKGVNRPRSHTYVPRKGEPDEDRFYMFKSMDGALTHFGMHGLRISSDMMSEKELEGKRRREKLPVAPGNKYVGLLLLFSIDTLEPLAIMPEGYLQRMRVGATSAVAAKYFTNPGVKRAGLIGSGWQAGSQVMGLREVLPELEEIRVYSIQTQHREAFAREWTEKLNLRVVAVDAARDAVQNVDMLALATNSQVPVLDGSWVGKGCHVNSVQGHEVDKTLVDRADLIIVREMSEPTFWVMGDKLPHEVSKRKSLKGGIIDPNKVRQLGDVVAGKVKGRTSAEQITMFSGSGIGGSAGLGTQFVAVGAMIYKRAREKKIGREIPTDWFLQEFRP